MNTRFLFGVPLVEFFVQGTKIEAIVDTGFTASLLLPLSTITELGLQKVGSAKYGMADGNIAKTEVFVGEIKWLGIPRRVEIIAATSELPLVGMELLSEARALLDPKKNILLIEGSD